jgi:hypothetical protein
MLLLIFGERKSDYYLSLSSHFLHELHLRVEFALVIEEKSSKLSLKYQVL